jgi:hypothetical protein
MPRQTNEIVHNRSKTDIFTANFQMLVEILNSTEQIFINEML